MIPIQNLKAFFLEIFLLPVLVFSHVYGAPNCNGHPDGSFTLYVHNGASSPISLNLITEEDRGAQSHSHFAKSNVTMFTQGTTVGLGPNAGTYFVWCGNNNGADYLEEGIQAGTAVITIVHGTPPTLNNGPASVFPGVLNTTATAQYPGDGPGWCGDSNTKYCYHVGLFGNNPGVIAETNFWDCTSGYDCEFYAEVWLSSTVDGSGVSEPMAQQ